MRNSPRSFRLVCKKAQIPHVESLLAAQGFDFESDPLFPFARRQTGGPIPLGSSIAAAFGYIYIQDRSSMLPPLALAPEEGAAVLDMCASPGSKSSLLGLLVGQKGFVLANEPSKNRLATLRRNLQTMNLPVCGTCSHPGERLPLPTPQGEQTGWERIMLDPPCSGWGTVEKNPQVLRLWQGDAVRPLIALQRRLLAEAKRLLQPGGRLVYSTCTTNAAENEEQIRYARDELGLALVPLRPLPGVSFAEPAAPEFDGVLRVETGGDGQGFFLAMLRKGGGQGQQMRADGPGGPVPAAPAGPDAASAAAPEGGQGFFARPWERGSPFVGERRRHGKNARRREAPQPHLLAPDCLDGPFTDSALLPPGDLAVYNAVIHLLPAARGNRLPDGFSWKGFPLGRQGKGGQARLYPRLRVCMPPVDKAGPGALVLDDIAPLLSLLSGRSLSVASAGPEVGLYYKELPLCRLPVKGGRAVLPPL